MTQLRIHLLGQLIIHQNSEPVTELSAKALEMFCYLLLYRDRPHTRETLATALWTDTPNERAQKYLRQTLWQLQTALDRYLNAGDVEGGGLLLLDPGWIRVNPQAAWWLDVANLEQAYKLCQEIPGAALTAEKAEWLEAAVALYRGDLLETWYQDWCIYERERLQLIYLAILDKLVAYCIAHQHCATGIDYGHRILRCDPARESTYQQLMRLHYMAGDRTTALREYARCQKALAREFGVEPALQTVALYEQIRSDRLVSVAPANVDGEHPSVAPASTAGLDLHKELAQLQANLADFQVQIQQQLAGIVRLLENQQKTH